MAPMTRSAGLTPSPDMPSHVLAQNYQQLGWQSGDSEMGSERENSEEPDLGEGNGYGEYDDSQEEFEGEDDIQQRDLDLEELLHPLRATASRVGREVERFAEVLDEFNPLRAVAHDNTRETALTLIGCFHDIAVNTVQTLRARHGGDDRDPAARESYSERFGNPEDDWDEEKDYVELDEENPENNTSWLDLERWEAEMRTWGLLKRLAQLRTDAPATSENTAAALQPGEGINKYSTESETWNAFLASNPLALERKTVLEWLQSTADESGEKIEDIVKDLQHKADRGDIVAHGWIHTKSAIKRQKLLHTWPQTLDPSSPEISRIHMNTAGTEPLVTQLDPDVTTRQNRKLESPDASFARSISLGCYEMLRRGKDYNLIKDFCRERTEIWRAVSMSGFPGQSRGQDDEDVDECWDPAASALWRRMCFALARNGGNDDYERAVYGILSGDISSVEPVCESWDDFIFVHYNALLRAQFDEYLQQTHPSLSESNYFTSFESFDAIQFHGDPRTAGKHLIETLKMDSRTSEEFSDPIKMLQGILVANQFEHFAYHQGLAVSKYAQKKEMLRLMFTTGEQPEREDLNGYIHKKDFENLRVVTHLLIVFKALGVDFGGPQRQSVVENTIVLYVDFLKKSGKEELLPLYCSQLSGNRRYATLSRNLIDVTDPEQRETQLQLMQDLGLDVREFISYQSRYLFVDYPDVEKGYPALDFDPMERDPYSDGNGRRMKADYFGHQENEVDNTDTLFIRSLEWYLLVDGLWHETFELGTMIYMRFFKHKRLTAARQLRSVMLCNDVVQYKTKAILGESLTFDELASDTDEGDVTERLDGTSQRKRLLKDHLLAEAKNYRALETLIAALDLLETVGSYNLLVHQSGNSSIKKKLSQQIGTHIQDTSKEVQPLLRGWLLTSSQEVPEFELLREAYLPSIVLGYISALELGGQQRSRDFLMECMNLSTIIAEEGSDILALFGKMGRLPELVEALARASKSLLIADSQSSSKRGGRRGKALRQQGWTPDIWSVKS